MMTDAVSTKNTGTIDTVRNVARAGLVMVAVFMIGFLSVGAYATYTILDGAARGAPEYGGLAWTYTEFGALCAVAAVTLYALYVRFSKTLDSAQAEAVTLRQRGASAHSATQDLEQMMARSGVETTDRAREFAQLSDRHDRMSQLGAELEALVAIRTAELEQRTRQLEASNKELESFSYSVSHDLRAPLRAISGFAEIVARRQRDKLDEQGRHYLDNIVRASANMGALIDDLLKYSRLGRSALNLRNVNTRDLVDELLRNFTPKIAESGAKVNVATDLPTIWGDRTLLAQIFANLIDNALTYRRRGVAPVVDIASTSTSDAWSFSVSDNGIGIPSEQFEKVFQPFQRLHSYDEYPGTGIGLALVSKAAAILGGSIRVESIPDHGSTFHFSLPTRHPPELPSGQSPTIEVNHDASGTHIAD